MATISLSDRPDDEQRAALTAALGAGGVGRILGAQDRGETLEGWRGRRLVRVPTSPAPSASEQLVDVDDHVTTPEEYLAREDARASRRTGESAAGGPYEGMAEAARGKRVAGRKRNVDRNGRAKPLRGETSERMHEKLLGRGPGRPRKGAEVRERVSVRLEPSTIAELQAIGKNVADFIEEALSIVRAAGSGAAPTALADAVKQLANGAAVAAAPEQPAA